MRLSEWTTFQVYQFRLLWGTLTVRVKRPDAPEGLCLGSSTLRDVCPESNKKEDNDFGKDQYNDCEFESHRSKVINLHV